MPAKSKSQQKLFGMIRHCQKTGECINDKIKNLSDKISKKDVLDFVSTKTKKLPNKKLPKKFKEWIEIKHPEFINEGSNPGSKTGLYALGYGGVGLYPPQWYLTRSADAIYYLSQDERIYKAEEKGQFDISHIPAEPKINTKMNCGEGGVWNIKKIKKN